jgi:hypothetical protein
MFRSRDRAILPLIIYPIEREEKPEQTGSEEQKQKKKCEGAEGLLAFPCLFPSRALLDQFQFEQTR